MLMMNTHAIIPKNSNKQARSNRLPGKQDGVMLLEAIISILIFSFGILAIVGLQAAAIKNGGDAKYRTDASMLTNQLIGQMWTDNRNAAVLTANYASPGGAKFQAWLNEIDASGLPGQVEHPPTIQISTITNAAVAGLPETTSVVTILIQWKAPSEAEVHKYTAVAHIF
jgi:type IV pilus assembly protein PilV